MSTFKENKELLEIIDQLQEYIQLQKHQLKSDWKSFEKNGTQFNNECSIELPYCKEPDPISQSLLQSLSPREQEKEKLIEIFSSQSELQFGLYEEKRKHFLKQLKEDYKSYLRSKEINKQPVELMVGIGKYSPNNYRHNHQNNILPNSSHTFQPETQHNLPRINEDDQFMKDLSHLSNHFQRLDHNYSENPECLASNESYPNVPASPIHNSNSKRLKAEEYRKSLDEQIRAKKRNSNLQSEITNSESILPGGVNMQALSSKPAFLSDHEAYLKELREQMELKKKKEEQEKLLDKMEEEKVNARVEEQRLKMLREYEEEINMKKKKEEERQQRVLFIQKQQQQEKEKAEELKRQNRMKKLQTPIDGAQPGSIRPLSPPSPPLPITRLEKEINNPQITEEHVRFSQDSDDVAATQHDILAQASLSPRGSSVISPVLSQLTSIRQKLKLEQQRLSKQLAGMQVPNQEEGFQDKYVPTWIEDGSSAPVRSQVNSASSRHSIDPSFSTLGETQMALKALIEKNQRKTRGRKQNVEKEALEENIIMSPTLEKLQERNKHREEGCTRNKGLLENTKLLKSELQNRHKQNASMK